MSRTQINYPKKNPKKLQDNKDGNNAFKKTVSIEENNRTIDNFFKTSSIHKSTSIIKEKPPGRQVMNQLKHDKTDPIKDYRLSRFNFYQSKKKKKPNIKKFFKKKKEEEKQKIDVSKFVLFSQKFSKEIGNIMGNNFLNNFKRYLNDTFQTDRKNIWPKQDLNISFEPFSKFIHKIFNHFITKYLLNTYPDLIYVSEKYMVEQSKQNKYSEEELLYYNNKPNIYFEYLPINTAESYLFYPELTLKIEQFIKTFRKTKKKQKLTHALILYRPNNDFVAYINKIRLICSQKGYNLFIKGDEINKLMELEKIKLINQNYIIGNIKEKNSKYLQIIDNISSTEKWKNFLQENNIYKLIEQEEEKIFNSRMNKTKSQNVNIRNKKMSKSQSTLNSTQTLTKKLLKAKNKKNKNEEPQSNTLLTFIGHGSSEEIDTQEKNEKNESKESIIAQNYKQNILEKFNKRKNVILFVDTFEDNEDNIKYVNQISSLIPNSRSPIIILTNNISLFNFSQKKYKLFQIENEGIEKKENIIYMTFLIIYCMIFLPNVDKENIILNDINNIKKNSDEINNNVIRITENGVVENNNEKDDIIIVNDNYHHKLNKIIKAINSVYIDTKLNIFNSSVYSSLITLSYILALIKNYELDSILIYLKNLFQFMDKQLTDTRVKLNTLSKVSLIKNKILEEIEEYQEKDDIEINNDNEDITKLNDIYEKNSFSDYEYGMINKIGEKEYEAKLKNYGINIGIDYNKESFFYVNEFFNDNNSTKILNYISNKEIQDRIIEDHKFFHNYYNSNNILNHSDINKINMILTQIISNERITLENTSKFVGSRYNKRNNFQNKELDPNIYLQKEKIRMLNKIFKKCNFDIFTKYINAHYGLKYFVEFVVDNKKYFIPDKLLFYNYFNDYYLTEEIQCELIKYFANDEDEDDNDNVINNNDEEEESDSDDFF